MGLSFFAGGGGAVSIWNSSENEWLRQTWTIAARKFMACASATAAGGAKGYVMCGGGEGDGTRVDVFEVTGKEGVAHTIQLKQNVGVGSLASPSGAKLVESVKKASAAGEGEVLMIAGGYSDTFSASGGFVTKGGYSAKYAVRKTQLSSRHVVIRNVLPIQFSPWCE